MRTPVLVADGLEQPREATGADELLSTRSPTIRPTGPGPRAPGRGVVPAMSAELRNAFRE